MHETRDFHAPDAGFDGALDELDLDLGRQDFRFTLQPVAGTDLDDRNAAVASGHSLASLIFVGDT